MSKFKIDLNADLGEGAGFDSELIPLLSSANIACGFHAGNPHLISKSVELCVNHNVHIGAHPSFPDMWGFGRREMKCSSAEIIDYMLYQIGAVDAFCKANNVKLYHVKPHGAIYNMASKDKDIALAIAKSIKMYDSSLKVFTQPGSMLALASADLGLKVVGEVFADRAYNNDGSLVSRKLPKSVLHDESEVLARTLKMVCDKQVVTYTNEILNIEANTVCLHGDNPSAIDLAKAIKKGLKSAGVEIVAP
ncbi:LamB/YcsF family protein [Clostridium sp. 'deep sea']|uniref:LamB/YcsF family protein n=1 Tax=Clostridium sp. 'deep sea' TaxID=2779445 RepID=UPI001896424E|nr:5-oxoprolinase subunit PxpA [Clostridium sp. 'deep sea']QOR34261.1 LamB/YcsF family protein [Clostridium sp. 'deep sea']